MPRERDIRIEFGYNYVIRNHGGITLLKGDDVSCYNSSPCFSNESPKEILL